MEISKVHIERMNFQKTADLEINKLHSDLTESSSFVSSICPRHKGNTEKNNKEGGVCVHV